MISFNEKEIEIGKYRSVYTVRNSNGKEWIVKPLKVGARRARLTARLLEMGTDCPVLPPIRWVGPGGYWYEGGNRFLITGRLPGREADYCRTGDFTIAIRTMATFHRWGQEILARDPIFKPSLTFDLSEKWEQRLAEMLVCKAMATRLQDEFSCLYLRIWPYYYNLGCIALEEQSGAQNIGPDVICYHDWAYHNLLIHGERGFLIDFDDMLVDRATHDRTNLLIRALRLGNWSISSLYNALVMMERYYPWQPGELRWVRRYLTFPFDFWILGRQYYIEQQPWSSRYYLDQFQRKISAPTIRDAILNWFVNSE